LSYTRALGAILIAAMLAACSGGGGGNTGFTPGGATAPVSAQKQRSGRIKATLYIPGKKKHQSARTIAYLKAQIAKHWHPQGTRKPKYLSGSTTELDFNLNTNNGIAATPANQATFDFALYTSDSDNCAGDPVNGYACTVTAAAPVGSDTYNVRAEQCSVSGTGPGATCASLGGTLTLLSASYATIEIPYNQTVAAAFTMDPVVASIDWATVTYANVTGPTAMSDNLWLTNPNGPNTPAYDASTTTYSCTVNASARRAHAVPNPPTPSPNGCYEPIVQNVPVAYGVVLEARDPNGSLIVGASSGSIAQTPVYVDSNGNAVSISWNCFDAASGATIQGRHPHAVPPEPIVFETGGGPFTPGIISTRANQSFNSPVVNPAADPDGGNTTDANGNPVTAVGNNGAEINWDGSDQPLLATPDYCSASTSNGLATANNFYLGLGEGGFTVPTPGPSVTPDGQLYEFTEDETGQPISVQHTNIVEFPPTQLRLPASTTIPVALPSISNGTYVGGAETRMAFDPQGNLWIAVDYGFFAPSQNGSNENVLYEYAAGSGANATPLQTIGFSGPAFDVRGLAIDASGQIYISTGQSILIYPANTTGTATPIGSIAGANTQIYSSSNNYAGPSEGIAFDASGNLWVSETASTTGPGSSPATPSLVEFAPGSTGNVAPINTYMDQQWDDACNNGNSISNSSLAFDPQGNLVISGQPASPTTGSIYITQNFVFPAGFTNSTCPHEFTTPVDGYYPDTAVDDRGYVYETIGNGDQNSGTFGIGIYPETATNGTSGFAPAYTIIPSGGNYPQAIAASTASGWLSGDRVHRQVKNVKRKP
jgi:hypothetical protein